MEKKFVIIIGVIVVIILAALGYLWYSNSQLDTIAEQNYEIAEVTDKACSVDTDCMVPDEYLVLSSCPFESRCINSRCTIVCPLPEPGDPSQAAEQNVEIIPPVTKDYFTNLKNILAEVKDVNEASYTIDMSGQGLTEFPQEILLKPSIKVLDLSNNQLTSVPAEIGKLVNLEELYLDNNNLTGALPAEIRHFKKLKVLDASGNNLTGIPAEIGQLDAIEAIDFKNNKLDGIPNEIENIADTLVIIDISGNNYTAAQVGQFQNKLEKAKVQY